MVFAFLLAFDKILEKLAYVFKGAQQLPSQKVTPTREFL